MKPAAAFSVGLWTGAAVVAAVGWFYFQATERSGPGGVPRLSTELEAQAEQIRLLQQEKAHLQAETQRLKETAAALKSNLEARAETETRRRLPVSRTAAGAPGPAPEAWIEEAVADGNVQWLPRLEAAALANNRHALEALALMAGQDSGQALMRVWRSRTLTLPNRLKATRYLAATMELNPDAEELLRGLVAEPGADVRLLYGMVDGIANPAFPVSLGRYVPIPAPPYFKPDYAMRLRLLDELRAAFADERLRQYAEQSRDELMTRWAQAESVSP